MRIYWREREGELFCKLSLGIFKITETIEHHSYSMSGVATLFILADAGWVELETLKNGISDKERNDRYKERRLERLKEYALFLCELETQ